MKRLFVVVGLLLMLCAPRVAIANPLDSFNSGLNDTIHPDVVYVEKEDSAFGTFAEGNRATNDSPISQVRNFIQNGFTFNYGSFRVSLRQPSTLLYFFTNQTNRVFILLAPIGLVFMWWGVRKVIRIVKVAWRNGRITS